MQRKNNGWLLATAVLIMSGVACSKDNEKKDPTVRTRLSTYVEKDGTGTVFVTDMPGDTTVTTPGAPGKDVYFSFVTNGTVDDSKKLTIGWDIAFTSIYSSFVAINSGTNNASPGFSGSGMGEIYVVDKPFDSVKTVPAASEVYAAGVVGMNAFPSPTILGWYNYNMTTHIMTPIGGRTFVIKLASGKYAKLQMVTLYRGNPASPSLTTPAPYLTFKYWVQQNGSTNLQIP